VPTFSMGSYAPLYVGRSFRSGGFSVMSGPVLRRIWPPRKVTVSPDRWSGASTGRYDAASCLRASARALLIPQRVIAASPTVASARTAVTMASVRVVEARASAVVSTGALMGPRLAQHLPFALPFSFAPRVLESWGGAAALPFAASTSLSLESPKGGPTPVVPAQLLARTTPRLGTASASSQRPWHDRLVHQSVR